MSLMLDELTQEVIKRIEASEGRSRSRTANEQPRFEHAVYVLLTVVFYTRFHIIF